MPSPVASPGVDLARPLTPDEVAVIETGMDRHAVLVFHDQPLTDEHQMAFSRNFGLLEDARGGNITRPEDRRLQPARSAPFPPSTRCCRRAS